MNIAEIQDTIPVRTPDTTRYRIRLEGEQQWRRVLTDDQGFYIMVKRQAVDVEDERIV